MAITYNYVWDEFDECCDNLFMMIACVERLNCLNDNMIMYMYKMNFMNVDD